MPSFIPYALRLGYTVEQAELAISRLGSDASTNDLLSLVISFNSSTSARKNDMKQKRCGRKINSRTRCLGYKPDKLSFVPVTGITTAVQDCGVEEGAVQYGGDICSAVSSDDVELSTSVSREDYIIYNRR